MKRSRLCVHLFVFSTLLLFSPLVFCEEIFHHGGTGDCQGCHTTPPNLLGSDASSTCLRCHQAKVGVTPPDQFYVATDPATYPLCVQLPPGGDFCWLKRNYSWSSGGTSKTQRSAGDSHGHNIIALDYGYMPDRAFASAPGGTYPSNSLSCISCHDPHGNYRRLEDGSIATSGPPVVASGSYASSPAPSSNGAVGVYRMLAGIGYQPKNAPGAPVFVADPPLAIAPSLYNRAETTSNTRVVYGSGMSEWCQNCHTPFNDSHMHPVGSRAVLPAEIITNYNNYIASGNITGSSATAYTSLVPYELGSKDYSFVKLMAKTAGSSGPAGTANVMCLSCHRAHASGWDRMLRWNMQADFIIYDGVYPGIDNNSPPQLAQGRTAAETQKAFYDRLANSFAKYQKNFCNKCHVKD
ncbi:MAG: cytochrome C [Geobacteraceae bacterium]|nr:cytochrome C [Geobacteraceae bacterium]